MFNYHNVTYYRTVYSCSLRLCNWDLANKRNYTGDDVTVFHLITQVIII